MLSLHLYGQETPIYKVRSIFCSVYIHHYWLNVLVRWKWMLPFIFVANLVSSRYWLHSPVVRTHLPWLVWFMKVDPRTSINGSDSSQVSSTSMVSDRCERVLMLSSRNDLFIVLLKLNLMIKIHSLGLSWGIDQRHLGSYPITGVVNHND